MPATIEEVTPVVDTVAEAESVAKVEEQAAEVKTDPAADQSKEEPAAVSEEVVVSIGDEKAEAQEKAPGWVRELRERNRQLARENKELRDRVDGRQSHELGAEPSLSDPDIDYDESKYKSRLAEFLKKKSALETKQQQLADQERQSQAAFQSRLAAYETGKTDLKAPNIGEAEDSVKEAFNEKQQAILIKCAKNPALMVLALGSNPGKLKELAGMTDLADFTYALASVEAQLKVTKKANIPDPEKRVEGTSSGGATGQTTLEKLREEAGRTGDMSKVLEYKRRQREAA